MLISRTLLEILLVQVEGCGINSIAQLFLDMGYEEQDELRFPAKKLRALWFSPPRWSLESEGGDAVNGPLPRIFISELLVEELSPQAQVHLFFSSVYINMLCACIFHE